MRSIVCGLWVALVLTLAAVAAPMPEPQPAWVQDAVRVLIDRGLMEGYPDGTLKGDRVATRWEVAMLLARLLARMEADHATLCPRQDLELVERLRGELQSELDALGVRVGNLEQASDRLDKRVTELERLTFYGSLVARVGTMGFSNQGSPGIGANQEFINFSQAVGSAQGAGGRLPLNSPLPGLQWGQTELGTFPMIDFVLGRPLTSGSSFTAVATLGVQARISEELRAGAEFKAYTSQGDAIGDAYYGVAIPYLANPFTGTSSTPFGLTVAGALPDNHQPYTRLVLDHVWLRHESSQTRLRLGTFYETSLDRSVYAPQPNPGSYHFTTPFFFARDEAGLPGFGIQVQGETGLTDDLTLRWEALGTRLADDLSPITNTTYQSHAEGATLGLSFAEERGKVRANVLHAANGSAGAGPMVGTVTSPLFLLQWVNPNGFFVNQLGGPNVVQVAGIGSSTDIRPVPGLPGLDGSGGMPGIPAFGGVGPQEQISYGLSAEYALDLEHGPRFFANWSQSRYRPQKNALYSTVGQAWRVGAEGSLADPRLDLGLEYLQVDPNYDPFLLTYPEVGGIPIIKLRMPFFDQLPFMYSLHDTRTYPNNRQGIRARVGWWFNDHGQLKVTYGRLQQVQPSLQDVRFSANSLAPGLPNATVLGFSPGFVEPFFFALSQNTFVPDGANLVGRALEAPRGQTTEFSLSVTHTWNLDEERDLKLTGFLLSNNFYRPSDLARLRPGPAGLAGENENFVDLTARGAMLRVDYDLTPDLSMHAAFNRIDFFGHYDTSGVYSPMAVASGQTRFDNVDVTQNIPELGFSWDLTSDLNFSLDGRYYMVNDHVSPQLQAAPRATYIGLAYGPQPGAHPFNWNGWQLMSTASVKF